MLSYNKERRRELAGRGKLIVQLLPPAGFFCRQELTCSPNIDSIVKVLISNNLNIRVSMEVTHR
jgi:hypothetical protein